MDRCILDTDILSEYLKGHNSVVAGHAAQYTHQHGVFSFTSVTVYEIVYGLEVKGASAQLQRVLPWLRQNDEIVPNAEDYRTSASIRAKATQQGAPLELTDCLIAAVAVRLGRPVVTGNTDDFRAIQRTGVKFIINNSREP
ncbi:MAG: PIN domain-containing protein [Terriglobia bacterium]